MTALLVVLLALATAVQLGLTFRAMWLDSHGGAHRLNRHRRPHTRNLLRST